MRILAAYALAPEGADGIDRVVGDLGPLEEALTGGRARRVGRHARMSLVGAAGCAKAAGESVAGDRTAVILGSSLGNLAETLPVVEQAVPAGLGLAAGAPSPVQFANSVSNSATFQAAKATGATGWNFVVSQEDRSFEAALLTAWQLLEGGAADRVLAGGTDERVVPRERTLVALELAPETSLGEGSGWLLLDSSGMRPPAALNAPGRRVPQIDMDGPELLSVALPPDLSGLPALLATHRRPGEPVFLLPGIGVDGTALAATLDATPLPYLDRTGRFPTAAAVGIAQAVLSGAPGLYLHATAARWGAAVVVFRIPGRVP